MSSIKNIKSKLIMNRYVHRVIENSDNYPVILRKIYRFCGVLILYFIHRFDLFDYEEEMENIRKNDYRYMFKKYNKNVTIYVPYFENDYIQKCIVNYSDFYESSVLYYLKNNVIKKDSIIFDIGANIGNHSLFFALFCDVKKIECFEPVKDTYEILKKNIEINGISDVVSVHNEALGRKHGKGTVVKYNLDNIGGTTIEEVDDGELSVRTIDELSIATVDFIKIDVEGHEYDVLLGGEKTLTRLSPQIFIEIEDENYERVNAKLTEYGYSMIKKILDDNYHYVKTMK